MAKLQSHLCSYVFSCGHFRDIESVVAALLAFRLFFVGFCFFVFVFVFYTLKLSVDVLKWKAIKKNKKKQTASYKNVLFKKWASNLLSLR